jgi:hypothetical protein
MGLVDWTSVGGKKEGNGVRFLKLESGRTYRIRPVMKPHIIWKYFLERPNGGFGKAITEDPNNCVIAKKYNEKAKQRFAVNVIDRADGLVKVLEGPISILKQIGTWATETNVDPGSNAGGEFAVRVECPGNDKKKTRYLVQFINYTPFSDAEKKTIKDTIYNLAEVFKPAPQDKIESWLFGEDESSPASTDGASEEVVSTKKSSSPVVSKVSKSKDELSEELDW